MDISNNLISSVLLMQAGKDAATQNAEKMDVPKVMQLAKDSYRYAYNNDTRMGASLIGYYEEGIKNPSVAKIIASYVTTTSNKKYGDMMLDDISFLRGNPWQLLKNYIGRSIMALARIETAKKAFPVNGFFERFEAKNKKLYKKTFKLREKLINDNRVVYDKLTPCLPKSFKKMLKYAKYL